MAGKVPHAGETNLFTLVQAIRELFFGRSLAVGQATLTANAASTVVSALNCGEQSEIMFSPRTANAAAEVGNGTMYVSAVTNGAFTIVHANNAQTDRLFGYAALG